MQSAAYTYALMLVILLGQSFSSRLSAQSVHQLDPFAVAAGPFRDLDSTALQTGLLAERGNPFMSLYPYSQNAAYHDSLTLDSDGLQMGVVTA